MMHTMNIGFGGDQRWHETRCIQKGLSEAGFEALYGTEQKCRAAVIASRWPNGFKCPACGEREYCEVKTRGSYHGFNGIMGRSDFQPRCNQLRLTSAAVFGCGTCCACAVVNASAPTSALAMRICPRAVFIIDPMFLLAKQASAFVQLHSPSYTRPTGRT
jgi:hypothetical protein